MPMCIKSQTRRICAPKYFSCTNRSKDSVVQDSREIIEFVKMQFYHALSDLEHLISTVHEKKN